MATVKTTSGDIGQKEPSGNIQVDGTTVHNNPLTAAKSDTAKLLEALKIAEAKLHAGAPDRSPREQLLAYGAVVQELMPEYRVRWTSVFDPSMAEKRRQQGYERIPIEEGGKALGSELVLSRIPRKQYEAQVAKDQDLHRRRMEDGGKQILINELDKACRELRDKHNIRIKIEDILNEG